MFQEVIFFLMNNDFFYEWKKFFSKVIWSNYLHHSAFWVFITMRAPFVLPRFVCETLSGSSAKMKLSELCVAWVALHQSDINHCTLQGWWWKTWTRFEQLVALLTFSRLIKCGTLPHHAIYSNYSKCRTWIRY